jgi:hypothetical protein
MMAATVVDSMEGMVVLVEMEEPAVLHCQAITV